MARTDPQVNLRIPAELKAQVDDAAKTNNRSMNAEIVARLQASFDGSGQDLTKAFGSLIMQLDKKAKEIGLEVEITLGTSLDEEKKDGSA